MKEVEKDMVKQDFSLSSKKMISANLDNEEYDKLLQIRDNNPELSGSASVVKWLIRQFDLSTQSDNQVSNNLTEINENTEDNIDRSDFNKWIKDLERSS